jgi:hypothetical protein
MLTKTNRLVLLKRKRFLNLTFASPCIIRRFKQINQQDARVSQIYCLTFMCSSTCFGRLFAHHQERTTALGASGFTVGALLVVVWQTMTNNAPTATLQR